MIPRLQIKGVSEGFTFWHIMYERFKQYWSDSGWERAICSLEVA